MRGKFPVRSDVQSHQQSALPKLLIVHAAPAVQAPLKGIVNPVERQFNSAGTEHLAPPELLTSPRGKLKKPRLVFVSWQYTSRSPALQTTLTAQPFLSSTSVIEPLTISTPLHWEPHVTRRRTQQHSPRSLGGAAPIQGQGRAPRRLEGRSVGPLGTLGTHRDPSSWPRSPCTDLGLRQQSTTQYSAARSRAIWDCGVVWWH